MGFSVSSRRRPRIAATRRRRCAAPDRLRYRLDLGVFGPEATRLSDGTAKTRPQLEILDGRLALSAGGTAALGVIKPHHLALNGEVSGKFLLAPGIPDVGSSQTLIGSGTVTPLGQVSASGTMKSPGFIARGRTTGTLNLSNANGSVTIQLTGPLKPGFATLPRKFTFKIVAATGQYVGDVDTGTATLDEVEADGIPTPSTSRSTVIVGPIFGLTLRSAHS